MQKNVREKGSEVFMDISGEGAAASRKRVSGDFGAGVMISELKRLRSSATPVPAVLIHRLVFACADVDCMYVLPPVGCHCPLSDYSCAGRRLGRLWRPRLVA